MRKALAAKVIALGLLGCDASPGSPSFYNSDLAEITLADMYLSVMNNAALGPHLMGYNGISNLHHNGPSPINVFVPAHAGLNFEWIVDYEESQEPRQAAAALSIDGKDIVLDFPADASGLKTNVRYSFADPHYVDVTIKHTPTIKRSRHMVTVWASYLNQPSDIAMHFLTRDGWVAAAAPEHKVDGLFVPETMRPIIWTDQEADLHPLHPFFYGVAADGRALVYMFDRPTEFWHSPTGGGQGNPAWDFLLRLEDYERDVTYTFQLRIAYHDFDSPQDVITEYETWSGEQIGPIKF